MEGVGVEGVEGETVVLEIGMNQLMGTKEGLETLIITPQSGGEDLVR